MQGDFLDASELLEHLYEPCVNSLMNIPQPPKSGIFGKSKAVIEYISFFPILRFYPWVTLLRTKEIREHFPNSRRV